MTPDDRRYLLTVTPAALAFNSERYDTHAFHDTSSNNSRLTVPSGKGGYYHIGGSFEWAGTNTTGERSIFIRLNGTTDISEGRFAAVAQTLGHHCSADYGATARPSSGCTTSGRDSGPLIGHDPAPRFGGRAGSFCVWCTKVRG